MVKRGFFKIGHRGAMAYEPENTLKSIKKGIELGANIIEIDTHMTKDKKLLVFHDASLDRTTNGKGLIKKMTREEVKKFCCSGNQEIPDLEQALTFLEKKKTGLNLEIKDLGSANIVLKQLASFDIKPLVVSSFYHSEIKKIKELKPEIKTAALLVGSLINPFRILKESKADMLDLCKEFVIPKLIKEANSKKIKVIVWKINELDEMRKFIGWGVDGIISDKPDLFKKI